MEQEEGSGVLAAKGAGSLGPDETDSLTPTQLRHFLEAPRRRPLLVLVPWAGVIVLSLVALLILPKKYRSSTFILVEREQVPDSFVPKVSTEDQSQQLEAVRPEILSRTRLETVLEETQPYPDIESRTESVEKMRSAISINVAGSDGFTIQFYHRDPHKAQEVTERLATLFINETVKARQQQVEGAVEFLVTQVSNAKRELEAKDEALRRYKERRMGTLPEQLQTNLATLQMLQREMQTVEDSLLFARERQDALTRGQGYISVGGTSAGAVPGTTSTTSLVELQRQLSSLRTRYREEHPDVQSLRARIARLEARQAQLTSDAQATAELPDLAVRQQIEEANLEVKRLEERRAELERRIATIRARVDETPRTEQELSTLTRDYRQLNENYLALLNRQLEAQMAGRLEQRWKGDRFRALDPASLPDKPYSPRRSIVLGLGVLFGLFVGLGASLAAEYLDPTVKDVEQLRFLQSHPVLTCIPHLSILAATAPPNRGDGIPREA